MPAPRLESASAVSPVEKLASTGAPLTGLAQSSTSCASMFCGHPTEELKLLLSWRRASPASVGVHVAAAAARRDCGSAPLVFGITRYTLMSCAGTPLPRIAVTTPG